MRRTRHRPPAARGDLLRIFSEVDARLRNDGRTLRITALGGVSLILLGIRERATWDIDVAASKDAVAFQKICAEYGIDVDLVSVASTVDFVHAPTVRLFEGRALRVDSVTPEDLLKLKLERFRKQDPEDIYAIIEKLSLSYERYQSLVQEMLPDFIGNPRELLLSALIVAEQVYPGHRDDFEILVNKYRIP